MNSLKVAALHVLIRLPGCRSLKEKRGRLGGLRDRFGRNPQIAVCETGHHDTHDLARFAFVGVASSAVVVEQLLADVGNQLSERVDGEVLSITRDWLNGAWPD